MGKINKIDTSDNRYGIIGSIIDKINQLVEEHNKGEECKCKEPKKECEHEWEVSWWRYVRDEKVPTDYICTKCGHRKKEPKKWKPDISEVMEMGDGHCFYYCFKTQELAEKYRDKIKQLLQ
jgi:hypothetical protein